MPGDSSTEVSEELIHNFLSVLCQCSLGPNEQPCSSLFTEATVFELRSQSLELMSDQLDMLILGRLDGHTKERVGMKRYRSYYFIRGHQVCRKTFLFLHCISKKRLLNLKSHLRSNGLAPRVHGNQKGTPHNRTPHSSLQNVVSFIDNYAQREGLSLPGRIPGYKSFRIKLLPTSTTKAELWRSHKHAAEVRGYTVVGYTKFVQTWNDFLPFIKITFVTPARKTLKKYQGVPALQKKTKFQPLKLIKTTLEKPNVSEKSTILLLMLAKISLTQ